MTRIPDPKPEPSPPPRRPARSDVATAVLTVGATCLMVGAVVGYSAGILDALGLRKRGGRAV